MTISDPDIRGDIVWTGTDRAIDDVRQAIDHAADPATPQEMEALLELAEGHLDATIETLPPECLIP